MPNIKKIATDTFVKYLLFKQKQLLKKKRYITSIKEYFSDNLDEIEYNIVIPAEEVIFNESERKFLKERIECKVKTNDNDSIFKQKEVFTCALKNVKFFGWSGGISFNDNVFVESTNTLSRLSSVPTSDSFFFKHKKKEGIFTSIMHYFISYNHFHWLIENCSRLYGLLKIKAPEINFIVPKDITNHQKEILRIFLDDRFKFVSIGYFDVWKLEKHYFPSFSSNDCSAYLPKIHLDFLKNKIINHYQIRNENKETRIYLSRSKGKIRRILNEGEFVDVLKDYDFNIVYAENLSFKEQVAIFNSSNVIISPFGAGLSNMIFSKNCKVLELFPPQNIRSHFFMLSKAMGFDYYYLIGENQSGDQDFYIDIKKAEEIIQEMIN